MFKLIALDVDGTLVGHDLQIAPRVHAAVQRALARGLAVTLATGRGAGPAEIFSKPLGLTTPLVCLQGAQVYDPVARRSLHEVRLAPAVLPWIAALAGREGWHLHFETPEMVYLPAGGNTPEALLNLFRLAAITRVDDFVTQMPEVPTKFLLAVHDPAERDELTADLRGHLAAADLPVALMTSHPQFVEGLPPGATKAEGLAWLIRQLGIAREEVLAIGDNDNDIAMLEWAGLGVAMGQGSPGALAAADWVAPGVAEDGAAVAIEEFALH